MALADILDRLHHIHQAEIRPREVHRDTQKAPIRYVALDLYHGRADLIDDVEVKLRREMRVLQHGDEHARRDHTVDGIFPACECLEPTDLARHRADLGLVVDHDVPAHDRLGKIADDVAAEVELLLHRGVKHRPHEIIGVLDGVASDLGAIHNARDVRHIRIGAVDARL